MKIFIAVCAIIGLAACQPSSENAAVKQAPDFGTALANHFDAITSRDLAAYEKTITKGDALPVIFPGGSMVMTKEEVLAFHEDWFADPDWIMEAEVIKTYVSGNLAVATTKYKYRDTANGEPRSRVLGLVFELQDGEWRLVHDQNTALNESN